jgi:hypothetical protein
MDHIFELAPFPHGLSQQAFGRQAGSFEHVG